MNTIRRYLSAILLIYVVLYATTLLLGDLHGLGALSAWWHQAWDGPATWIGIHVWHLPKDDFASGAVGDSPLEFALSLFFAGVAVVAGTIWGRWDRSEGADQRRLRILGILLRLGLAADLFVYGFAKVFPSQFPVPDGGTLMRSLGDFSPQELYWMTMGIAPAYAVFAGCLEVAVGALLAFRRTALAGALLAAGVMANVVMVNLAYGVPVKLRALHLLGMALLLVAMEWERVWAFLSNRAMSGAPIVPAFTRARLAFLGLFAWAAIGQAIPAQKAWRAQVTHRSAPLVGGYEPEALSINGQDKPILLTDPACWRRVWIADLAPVLYIYRMDGTAHGFHMKINEATHELVLEGSSIQGPSSLHYSEQDKDHLVIEGQLGNERISARLRRLDEASTPLRSQGFHWMED